MRRNFSDNSQHQSITNQLKKISQNGSQFFQVNYLDNQIYKLNSQKLSYKISKEQEIFKDYLYEVDKDSQKKLFTNCELKKNYFKIKTDRYKLSKTKFKDPLQELIKFQFFQKTQNPFFSKRNTSFNIELSNNNQEKNKITKSVNQNEEQNKKNSSLINSKKLSRSQVNDQIKKLIQYSQIKKPNKKKFRSSSQKQKDNQKIAKQEREQILQMVRNQHLNDKKRMTMNELPNVQKYSIQFVNYLKTKTKLQLDKYIHQQKIKKPQKDLQKFQNFLLKEVKMNRDHKHKMQKFFIKMREEFRRVQKHTKNNPKRIDMTTPLLFKLKQKNQNQKRFQSQKKQTKNPIKNIFQNLKGQDLQIQDHLESNCDSHQ